MGSDNVEGREPEVRRSRMVWALRRERGGTEIGEKEAEAKPIG